MINKIAASIEQALTPLKDGDSVIGGFGSAGQGIALVIERV